MKKCSLLILLSAFVLGCATPSSSETSTEEIQEAAVETEENSEELMESMESVADSLEVAVDSLSAGASEAADDLIDN